MPKKDLVRDVKNDILEVLNGRDMFLDIDEEVVLDIVLELTSAAHNAIFRFNRDEFY